MITIGLTGGFGTGKTTVLGMFHRLGAVTVNADDLVHQELRINKALQNKIGALFGRDIFRGGRLSRLLLARKVFASAQGAQRLNALVHPLVAGRLKETLKQYRRQAVEAVLVAEVPLLFEAGFDKIFDLTVVVAAADRTRRARLLAGSRFSRQDIRRRQRCQLPLAAKISRCSFIIDNNKDKKSAFAQVKRLMEEIKSGKIRNC